METVLDAIRTLFDIRLFLLCVLIVTPLEALLPARRDKKILRPGLRVDVLHFFLSSVLTRLGLLAVVAVALKIGDWAMPVALRQGAASLPLWLQVVLCTLIADLGFYAAHRMMHEVPWLWRFHAIHHSSEQLDWLAAFRVHPVDQVIVKGASLLPVFVIGFTTEAIAIASFIYMCQSLLIHSNIRVGFGRLNRIIASPVFHHWHHANEDAACNKNYSGQLALWDVMFGTLHLPRHRPGKYGVDEKVPPSYADQMFYPFRQPASGRPDGTVEVREGALSRE